MIFQNRSEAGKKLADRLKQYSGDASLLILALPRGGVPVAYEVAKALNAPLDVFLVRKLGVPAQEELAMGAIAMGGVRVLNESIVQHLRIPEETIAAVAAQEQRELERREKLYRKGRPALEIKDHTVILIDDGLATGATMRAAVAALRELQAKSIVVAVPVAAQETCDEFRPFVDHLVCLETPEPFYGVGVWYKDFSQTSDEEVIEILKEKG